MKNITIRARSKNYTVFFENDWKFLNELKKLDGIWVIDAVVHNLYQKYFAGIDPAAIILFDAREANKNLDGVVNIYRQLLEKGMKRNRPFISVGGGITQDVSGFVASTLYRGIKWIYVPTTLLAQADSCIGSKTSLNFDSSKNLLGTFYAPDQVYLGAKFLDGLTPRERYSGFGEIVKLQLTKTKSTKDLHSLIRRLENNEKSADLLELTYDSLLVKKKYIEEDEFDHGRRRILNYGHCLGHALESVSKFSIPHGLAVVIGMLFANVVALKRKQINPKLFEILAREIFVPHVHRELLNLKPSFFDAETLFNLMKKDKKRTGGGVALVLPLKNFRLGLVQDLAWEEFLDALRETKNLLIK